VTLGRTEQAQTRPVQNRDSASSLYRISGLDIHPAAVFRSWFSNKIKKLCDMEMRGALEFVDRADNSERTQIGSIISRRFRDYPTDTAGDT